MVRLTDESCGGKRGVARITKGGGGEDNRVQKVESDKGRKEEGGE